LYKDRCEALQTTLSNVLTQQTALNAKIQRLEREVELRRRDPQAAGSAELQEKNDSISELLKERAALDEEVAKLKAELDDERALSSRYKKTMNAARTVAEAAIVESRTLRAELNTYRRNDPDPKPDISRTEDSIPEELKPMFEDILAGKEVKPTVSVDKGKFDEAMREAQKAENAKDFSTALWHYLIAADVDPSSSVAQLSLARVHYALKHAETAMKAYEKALQLGAKRDPNLENMLKAASGGASDKD
jgi:tetratricopeptide (TPR) repeat protein